MAKEPKQVFNIPELDSAAGKFQLELSTRKYSNGKIVSAVHGQFVKDGMATFQLFGDFRKQVLVTAGMATQKRLDMQHNHAFGLPGQLEELKNEALAFYAAKYGKV